MDNQVLTEFGRQASHMASAPAFREDQVLQRIAGALGPAPVGRVLELACGPGIVAEVIAPFVSELVCVDATPEMLALAESRLAQSGRSNATFCEAFAEALPFAAAEFDVIVTRLAFHHFKDIQAVLAECRRVLRPNGRLVAVDITSSANPEESALHNALEQLRDPTHVHMFSRPEFLDALRTAGFEPVQEETWVQPRSFSEWAKIISMPGRTDPLRQVMQALCRSGLHAGVALHEAGDDIGFTHSWILVVATAVAAENT